MAYVQTRKCFRPPSCLLAYPLEVQDNKSRRIPPSSQPHREGKKLYGMPCFVEAVPSRPDYCMELLSLPVHRGGTTQTLESGIASSLGSICPSLSISRSVCLLFHEIRTIKPLSVVGKGQRSDPCELLPKRVVLTNSTYSQFYENCSGSP